MNRLSQNGFAAARDFLKAEARPLERARFAFHFEGADEAGVWDALWAFQNSDGGFGRALEPDVRAPQSSVLCTTIALQVARAMNAPPPPEPIQSAIGYLLSTYNADECHFPSLPEVAAESPHAPWWRQEGRREQFDRFDLNPTAEVLGYLYEHRAGVPDKVLANVSERVVQALAEPEEEEMHGLFCCQRLWETPGLPQKLRDSVEASCSAKLAEQIETVPEAWKGYTLEPLKAITSPQHPLYPDFREAVEANLRFLIDAQEADGWWTLNCDWGKRWPDELAQAQRDWKGWVTLETLLLLEAFGCLPPR